MQRSFASSSQAKIFVTMAALWSGLSSLPALAYMDPVNREWFSTAKALSMGNAGIATADDPATAMFYNPAALSALRNPTFEVFNPQFDMSTGNFSAAGGVKNLSKLTSLERTYELLNAKRGTPISLGTSVYPNISAKNFGFGILARWETGAYVDGNGALHYRSQTAVIPTMGTSIGFFRGLWKFGVAVRAIQLTEANESTTVTSNIGYTKNAHEGFGFGLDFGTMLTFPWDALPTLAFVARDIGDTSLKQTPFIKTAGGTVDRPHIKQSYDGGFSIAPKVGNSSVLKIAAEYRDILDASGTKGGRKVNLGFDLTLARYFSVRWGVSQGYWSLGIGLSGKSASLDLGTYGKELSTTEFRSVEDRRLTLRYSNRF